MGLHIKHTLETFICFWCWASLSNLDPQRFTRVARDALLGASGLCLWLCSQPPLRTLGCPCRSPAAPRLSLPRPRDVGTHCCKLPGAAGEQERWEAQLKGGMRFVLEPGVRRLWCRTLPRVCAERQLRGDTTHSFSVSTRDQFPSHHTSIKSFPG